MNANNETFAESLDHVTAAAVRPFLKSRRIYVEGSRHDIRVPMREIHQSDTHVGNAREPNPPVYIYDTTGPYTDPLAEVNLLAGLPALRLNWITERGDTTVLAGPTSEYGRMREADPSLSHLRMKRHRAPRRAKPGANVTQMHYGAAASPR
jgi:phosphomethylpyrimidine synthase